MKRFRILLIILLLVTTGVAAGLYYINRPLKNAAAFDAAFVVSSEELIAAYEADEQQADKKFIGKIIEVHGKVTDVNARAGTLTLAGDSEMSSVSCEIDNEYHDKISNIQPGDIIAVKGECAGYLMDVILKRAVLVAQ